MNTEELTLDNSAKPNSKEALALLQIEIEKIINPLGYDLVFVEFNTFGGQRILRIFIDFLSNINLMDPTQIKRISLEDCVAVNHGVDLLLEETLLIDGAYNLEVSSPGLERPLRKSEDYERFKGQRVRIHTFRPLNDSELGSAEYWEKNKKQKNFIGELLGLSQDKKSVFIKPETYKSKQEGFLGIYIPLEFISKAHLEMIGG